MRAPFGALALGLAAAPALAPALAPAFAPAFAQAGPAFPARLTAIDLGAAFRGADPGVLGMDAAYSLPLRGGRSVWVFGDTLLGAFTPAGRRTIAGMPPNSAAFVDDADWVTGFAHARFAGTPHPAVVLQLPARPPDRRVWPLDLVTAGGHTWLFFVEIRATGTGPLDFAVTGSGVARMASASPLRFAAAETLWGEGAPTYGSSVVADGSFLYAYASGDPMRLARVPLGQVDERAAYRYWTGAGWDADPAKAAGLPAAGPELSVRRNAYLGGFLLIDTPAFGKAIQARFARAPEGPWGAPVPVAACQPANDPDASFYGAKQHVELDADGGRSVVLSYNTNTAPDRLADRPDLYWPRLVRVTFAR